MFGWHSVAAALGIASDNQQSRRHAAAPVPDTGRTARPQVDDMFETIPSLIRRIPTHGGPKNHAGGTVLPPPTSNDTKRAAALALLGLSGNPGDGEIRHAFNEAVKKCHPDLAGKTPETEARFREVVAAFGHLKGHR